MDIYRFLNSPDIANHCKTIKHEFTPLEMAVIVHLSHCPASEKMAGYMEIIRSTPDMPVHDRPWFKECESLHQYLQTLYEYEETELSDFCRSAPDNTYVVSSIIYRDRRIDRDDDVHGAFSTVEKARQAMKSHWNADEIEGYVLEKVVLNDMDAARPSYLFSQDGAILNTALAIADDALSCLDGIYINIPTPFEKGDIVTIVDRFGQTGEPLVLTRLDCWSQYHLDMHLLRGDNTDMLAQGYSQDEIGILDYADIGYYFDLQFYRGKLTGKDRLLHYASLFMKGEIELPELLNMQCRLVAEHLSDEHCINIPKDLLAENRKEEVMNTNDSFHSPEPGKSSASAANGDTFKNRKGDDTNEA